MPFPSLMWCCVLENPAILICVVCDILHMLIPSKIFGQIHSQILGRGNFIKVAAVKCISLSLISDRVQSLIYRGYYTVARRYEFYVRVARTISRK